MSHNEPAVREYLADFLGATDPVADFIEQRTDDLRRTSEGRVPGIMPRLGARLLTVLTRARETTRALEIGTFTGMSSVAIARGLAPGGKLLCLDVSEDWTDVAREAWDMAGVSDRVELRLGPALETLAELSREAVFDLAFIDADKEGYADYLSAVADRLRPGALVIADNALWHGKVADPQANDPITTGIRAFNDALRTDDRFESLILPLGDGLAVAARLPS